MPRRENFSKKPMTKAQIAKVRAKAQAHVFNVVNALHDAGFSSLLVESIQVGHDSYYTRIVIDREELGTADVQLLIDTCEDMTGCHLVLRNDYKNGPRLAVWVSRG